MRYQQKTSTNEVKPRQYDDSRRSNQNYNKPRFYQKDNNIVIRSGFEYDEKKIGFNTQIPNVPEKLKNKPDQVKFDHKVSELQKKVDELKKQRKQKKDTYKNGNQGFRKQIDQSKHNIALAKACIIILNADQKDFEQNIEQIEGKINFHRKKIDLLSKPIDRLNKNLKIQEMNYSQLIRQQEKVTQDISTKRLTKSQEIQLSQRLNRITKRKLEVPKSIIDNSHENQQRLEQAQSHKNSIDGLRNARDKVKDQLTDITMKLQSINESIIDFEQTIEQIHEKQRNTDNAALLEEAAELKTKIYTIWDEITALKEQFNAKNQQYEKQQELIKYIKWANNIKQKKKEQWQLEKQQRKKQKLREKGKKQDQQKTVTVNKDGTILQKKPQYQRKKINRNQKQIDTCSFLIQYCKDLNLGNTQAESKKNGQKQVNLEDALKKGQWSGMKNIQVLQSKKAKNDQEVEGKHYKKKQNKSQVIQTTDRFSHTYFVAQTFDAVKVLPPAKFQQLQKTINELEDKLEYYLAHPDEGVEKTLIADNRTNERNAPEKTKVGKGKKVINTEEFPSLN